ncbi:MAG: hypothetical protein HC888_04570 [Candidatus Competibacteraceae bacterium]|nr:hypothetical protein [Candidatus Competibacteraceae bacterium]
MKLVAYDFERYRKTQEERQIWFSMAVSTGSSGDLRLVMPYLITALKPYIGRTPARSLLSNSRKIAKTFDL